MLQIFPCAVQNDNLEMIQLVSTEHDKIDDENPRSNLLTRIKSMRHGSNGSVRGASAQRASATNSSIVSGQAHSDLRRREVVLAKISLYMVFVFLICHSVKIVPNIYEMLQTYLMVSQFFIYIIISTFMSVYM